jgi:hypothetical protein
MRTSSKNTRIDRKHQDVGSVGNRAVRGDAQESAGKGEKVRGWGAILDSVSRGGTIAFLGLALLLIEAGPSAWIFRASTGWERGTAGVLMVCGIVAVAAMGFRLERIMRANVEASGSEILSQETLRQVAKGATLEEINRPTEEEIGGPEGNYKITRTPMGWDIDELSYAQYNRKHTDALMGKHTSNPEADDHSSFGKVLLFTANNKLTWIPRPGISLINGRIVPIATDFPLETELAIIPMRQFSPPLFQATSFYSNIIKLLSNSMNITKIKRVL